MKATWLADVLRDAGCKVETLDGWENRGRDLAFIEGVVWHHTATGPNVSDDRVARLLRDGRPDLAGPLSQLGLERDGTYVVIAAGRCNHNGFGTWGNQSIGIEAYNDGVGEKWPAAQLDAYDRGTAAILAHLGYGVDRMKGHKETDPGRKPDPVGIDMNAARQRVAHLITYRPPSQEEWSDMASEKQIQDAVEAAAKAHAGEVIGWVRALHENPDLPQDSKRLRDRAGHLNPYRKK